MVIVPSRPIVEPRPAPVSVKFLITGGFGVGKTTFVSSVSEITPLTTDETISSAGRLTDDPDGLVSKSTTTVAMDFGRVTVDDGLRIYLFGTPGQDRFEFMWDDLGRGALGAVVLVDPRRLADAYTALDHVERRGMPHVIVLNHFDTRHRPDRDAIRYALNVGPRVPIVDCDARDTWSAKAALLTTLDHLVSVLTALDPDPV